ncbi:general transcription repressor [Zalaria obscura]|uniref:General transcription repressor n=1 Tax=Zalaria obscura TaxID=2024903 RepID=A0ACC3SG46_9PEZI
MYNAHRGIPPGPPQNNRLADLLEQVRAEFENQGVRANDYEHQYSGDGTGPLKDLHVGADTHGDEAEVFGFHIRFSNPLLIRLRYEEEVAHLRRELEARGGPSQSSHTGPSQPPPPAIGHGPANLFQGIMAGGAAQGGPGLAPPPQEQPQQPGMPAHMPQGPPGLNPAPGPPQHAPFGGYGQPAPGVNGYGPQPPQPTASPGPGKPRLNARGPPGGPATPQQANANPYPGSPQVLRPTPPPGQPQQQQQMALTHQEPDYGNQLCDYSVDSLPARFKREGDDWYAVFNPRIRRTLDVELVHNLVHQSVVCCVRFSRDGRFVATGCNRSAQIFEVDSGQKVSHLQDNSLSPDGDLYIRSVCFSPDGAYLATGAEDKIIRIWDIATRTIRHQFTGHEQDIYSLDYSSDGRFIASGSGDRTVRVWDIPGNQCIICLTIEDGVTTVAISPDNRYLAAGSLDKSVRVWEMGTGNLLERLEEQGGSPGHKDSVYSVAFSPTSRELVSGSLDRTIRMWELQPHNYGNAMRAGQPKGGKCIRTFEGHKDFVLSVALTPDGNWVLSGSKDRGVQFWNPHNGEAQLMLQGHKNSVISVAPSPARGGLFATGSGDMRARIWSERRAFESVVYFLAQLIAYCVVVPRRTFVLLKHPYLVPASRKAPFWVLGKEKKDLPGRARDGLAIRCEGVGYSGGWPDEAVSVSCPSRSGVKGAGNIHQLCKAGLV